MKTIITIQHPQSQHHINGMVGSWADWPLTELGIRQAENIGRNLSREQAGRDWVLYTSDLTRATQTAAILGRFFGVTPIPTPALRERNLGQCVGRSVAWMRENMVRERTVDDRMFPDAESRREEWQRLEPFFRQLLAGPHEYILIVSHGDLLSVFNAMWLGLDVQALNRFELFGLSGGVSILREDPDGKRFIRKLSDLSYMTMERE